MRNHTHRRDTKQGEKGGVPIGEESRGRSVVLRQGSGESAEEGTVEPGLVLLTSCTRTPQKPEHDVREYHSFEPLPKRISNFRCNQIDEPTFE